MLRDRKHSKEEKINNDNKLSCQGKYWCLHAKENVYLKTSYSPNRHIKNKQTLFASARCYFRIKPSHALKCRTSLSSGLYVQVRGIPSVAHSACLAWCSLSALLSWETSIRNHYLIAKTPFLKGLQSPAAAGVLPTGEGAAWSSTGKINSKCFSSGKEGHPRNESKQRKISAKECCWFSAEGCKQWGHLPWLQTGLTQNTQEISCLCQALLCSTNLTSCMWSTQPKEGVILLRCTWIETKKGKFCSWGLSNSSKQPLLFCFQLQWRDWFFRTGHHLLYLPKKIWSLKLNAALHFSLNSSTNDLTFYLQSPWLISWYCTWMD